MCTNSLTTATFLLPFLTNEQHFLKQTKETRCVVAIKIILQMKTWVFIMHSHSTGLKMKKGSQLSKLTRVVDFFHFFTRLTCYLPSLSLFIFCSSFPKKQRKLWRRRKGNLKHSSLDLQYVMFCAERKLCLDLCMRWKSFVLHTESWKSFVLHTERKVTFTAAIFCHR